MKYQNQFVMCQVQHVINQISCDHCVKKRQCDDKNTKFGFTHTDKQHYPQPWPIIFDDILMSSSLKPFLLQQHLET